MSVCNGLLMIQLPSLFKTSSRICSPDEIEYALLQKTDDMLIKYCAVWYIIWRRERLWWSNLLNLTFQFTNFKCFFNPFYIKGMSEKWKPIYIYNTFNFFIFRWYLRRRGKNAAWLDEAEKKWFLKEQEYMIKVLKYVWKCSTNI